MAEGKETLCTLRITFEELQKRSEVLSYSHIDTEEDSGHDDHHLSQAKPNNVGMRGLLYLPPTKNLDSTSSRERSKRSRGKNQTRSATSHEQTPTTSQEKRNASRSKANHQLPRRSAESHDQRASHGEYHSRQQNGRGPVAKATPTYSGWSQYENKKIESALSKWCGDHTKLDAIIRTW